MKSYKFRIYPNKAQEKELCRHLWIAKELWNNLLEATIKRYNEEKKFYSKSELQLMVKNSGLYSQTAQGVAHRLDRALKAKIRKKKKGEKGGFPRFKSFYKMKSLVYPQSGFSLNQKLKVSPFGEISIVKHREIEGEIKTLTIKRMPSGKWFASFVVDVEPKHPEGCKPPRENKGGAVGMDVGLMKFATLSDGGVIESPHHLARHEERLATLQRRLSKKAKRGKNRWKARVKVARLHEKVANDRMDFLHKTANELLSRYSLIALEGLAIQEMAMDGHGKGINDAGWGMFANILGYKAESAGCRVVFVNPKDTSKECSGCGQLVEKSLWDRTHDCPNCGLMIDRDLNAAINILTRATVGQTGSNASGDGTIVPSLKEEAHAL